MNRVIALSGLFLLFLMVGCSSGKRVGTVSGILSLDGQPLENATVTFVSADGTSLAGATDGTGHYIVENVPVGPTMVSVLQGEELAAAGQSIKKRATATPQEQAAMDAQAAKAKAAQTKVPAQYADPAGSGLKTEIKEGTNEFDIPLKK